MSEYVKGLVEVVRMMRADMEAAKREHDAAVQELVSELGKAMESEKAKQCPLCMVAKSLGVDVSRVCSEHGREKVEKRVESIGPHTHARDTQGIERPQLGATGGCMASVRVCLPHPVPHTQRKCLRTLELALPHTGRHTRNAPARTHERGPWGGCPGRGRNQRPPLNSAAKTGRVLKHARGQQWDASNTCTESR